MLALKLGQSLPSHNAAIMNADLYSIQLTGTEYMSADAAASEFNGNIGTFSVWTKVSTMSGGGNIFRVWYDANNFMQMFYHAGTNQMRFVRKASGTGVSVEITDVIANDGLWHHIIATWDFAGSDSITIWLDGVLKDTESTIKTFDGTSTLFDVGQNTTGASFYKGFLDELAVFDEVIDVDLLRLRGKPFNLTGMNNLVGYWRFNEGIGSTASDSSGKGNTGTLYNSPAWTTDTP